MSTLRLILFLVIVFLVGILLYRGLNSSSRKPSVLTGKTMGTEYHVTFHNNPALNLPQLQEAIDTRLEEINRSMSTWIENSEISKINKTPEGEWISVSGEFGKVLQSSIELSEKTYGAFDVTVGPIVNLWGFGPEDQKTAPSGEQIRKTLKSVGYRSLNFVDGRLRKKHSDMYLDFSAIAKGYGVDEIAALLDKQKIDNYSVEIGGEVVVKGLNPKGKPWVIGIEMPKEGPSLGEDFITAVNLTHGALATSGTYRIFREDNSKKSSHIIDPKTGEAVHSNLVSVTVYAPSCMEADGIATALMVMGVEGGLKWVENQSGIEALFLMEKSPSEYSLFMSTGFSKLIQTQ